MHTPPSSTHQEVASPPSTPSNFFASHGGVHRTVTGSIGAAGTAGTSNDHSYSVHDLHLIVDPNKLLDRKVVCAAGCAAHCHAAVQTPWQLIASGRLAGFRPFVPCWATLSIPEPTASSQASYVLLNLDLNSRDRADRVNDAATRLLDLEEQ